LVFNHPAFDDHERVLHLYDAASGLKAIIALHSARLGPAAGGCRLWTYANDDAALTDVLRLSRGMSYKNALAGVPMGGGKAVLLGPVSPEKRREVFLAFGDAVQSLSGTYITAEDVGVGVADMDVVASRTRFVSGRKAAIGQAGGDPGPYTARGVRIGIEAALKHRLGRDDLKGVRVAVQGLGGVGANLCRELYERGASLIVADLAPERVEKMHALYGAGSASIESILLSDVDVVAPCALGAIITQDVAAHMKAPILAGSANNQLADAKAGNVLLARDIAYVPDYLINAGGIIAASAEYFGQADAARVEAAIAEIGLRALWVLQQSKAERRSTQDIADEKARSIIAAGAPCAEVARTNAM
jgi:leucine dehydrogenase